MTENLITNRLLSARAQLLEHGAPEPFVIMLTRYVYNQLLSEVSGGALTEHDGRFWFEDMIIELYEGE